MTIFTDRDLERVAKLRTNWRQEFLLEVVRLRHERDIAKRREADAKPIFRRQPKSDDVARGGAQRRSDHLIIS